MDDAIRTQVKIWRRDQNDRGFFPSTISTDGPGGGWALLRESISEQVDKEIEVWRRRALLRHMS